MGLSRLAAKCRNCPDVDKCDHKEMEALGFMEPASQAAASSAAAPVLRETVEIRVAGEPVTVYRDEIERQLYRELYRGLQFGA